MAEQPAARLIRDGHLAEVAAVDVGDPVVLRQPLVDERVVGRQELGDAAVLAHDVLEQELGLAPHRLPQVVVEIRELLDVRPRALQVAQEQPLAGEVLDERRRARIGEHSLDLLVENVALAELALRGERRAAASSGGALQRKNASRDASAASSSAYSEPGAAPSGSGSSRNRNFGLVRITRNADSMPASNPPRARAGIVETEQRRDVLLRRLAPIGAARERRENFGRRRRAPSTRRPGGT